MLQRCTCAKNRCCESSDVTSPWNASSTSVLTCCLYLFAQSRSSRISVSPSNIPNTAMRQAMNQTRGKFQKTCRKPRGRLRKVIWIPDEKLSRVFDLGVAIHGSEFFCFLDTFICYWVWGKRLKVPKNFVYPGQQRRFLRNFWWHCDSRLRSVTDIEAPRRTRGEKKTSDTQQALIDIGVVT